MDARLGLAARGGSKKSLNSGVPGSHHSGSASSVAMAGRSTAKSAGVNSAGDVTYFMHGGPNRSSLVPPPMGLGLNNPSADSRSMRRIIADDPEWSLATVPDLVELTIKHIVDNFSTNSSILNKLPPKHRSAVLKRISTDLPVKVTARLVDDDDYWKRCCMSRWPVCDVSQYGGRWKRMFFERNLQSIIESYVPESTKPAELQDALELSANYVRRLTIRQLLPPIRDRALHGPPGADSSEAGDDDPPSVDHFDFNSVLPRLPFLDEFSVTYGVSDCGMNFEWSLFQFTMRDCRLLADCINACRTLRSFSLLRSKVDDEKVRILVSHILDHPVLAELDLSHNVVGDHGARALGKLLVTGRCRLTRLGLADNAIRAAGAQALAHALTRNSTLQSLDLRLNRLGDDGGQAICKALLRNSTVSELVLAGNELTEPTASLMAQVISKNTTLSIVDLSNNRLGQVDSSSRNDVVFRPDSLTSFEQVCDSRAGARLSNKPVTVVQDGGRQLQEGIIGNQTITAMDLRLTECGQEAEYCINEVLTKNRERRRAEYDLKTGNFSNQRSNTVITNGNGY